MTKGQTKIKSIMEVVSSTLIGFATSIITQLLIFPLYDIKVTHGEQFFIAIIFMVVSIIRSYLVRRLFNWIDFKRS